MNVLLWYQAFMEEGLILDPLPGIGKGFVFPQYDYLIENFKAKSRFIN